MLHKSQKKGVNQIESNEKLVVSQEIKTENEHPKITQELFKQLTPGHIQILESIYVNYKVIYYKQIWDNFNKKVVISDKTLRKRIKELADLGLIELIKSYNLMIRPIPKLKKEILDEIQIYRMVGVY